MNQVPEEIKSEAIAKLAALVGTGMAEKLSEMAEKAAFEMVDEFNAKGHEQ